MNNIIIYEKDNKYYMLVNGVYVEQSVIVKRYTISITPMPDGEVLTELEGATEYTFKELKDKLMNN